MYKLFSITMLLLGLFFVEGKAQEQIIPCGTVGEMAEPIMDRLRQNMLNFHNDPIQFRDIQYFGITFHIVAKSDGTGGVSEQRVLDQLCVLNEDFAPMNIQFFIKNFEFNYINNTTVYNDHPSTQTTFMSFNKDNNSINMFIVNDANPADGGPDEGTVLRILFSFP